jgi:UDP:flavonoid glycosyltransferase YjiC (YdhE family)
LTVESGSPLRLLIGAFGDPGHAFPAIALGKALRERGHQVEVQTWQRWRPHVEAEGMGFHAAPEYQVFPTRERPLKPYAAVVRAATETRPLIRRLRPDAVVADILTLAPALAAEMEGRPWATLVPHIYPESAGGLPPYGLGAGPPRRPLGRAAWRALDPLMTMGLEQGRRELNETRRRVGLPALEHVHGGISRDLCLVGTFPQLEYPRAWRRNVHVTGPLLWEPPAADVDLPEGEAPLVVVAPSTSQDPDQRLLQTALEALSTLPVRVLATYNRHDPPQRLDPPPNARLVEWISYSRSMPHADLVVCHGGHGTLVRALASGAPVVVVPSGGDQAENGARLQYSGAGLSLRERLLRPWTLRLVAARVLEERSFAGRAGELASWLAGNDGAAVAACLVEQLARSRRLHSADHGERERSPDRAGGGIS